MRVFGWGRKNFFASTVSVEIRNQGSAEPGIAILITNLNDPPVKDKSSSFSAPPSQNCEQFPLTNPSSSFDQINQ